MAYRIKPMKFILALPFQVAFSLKLYPALFELERTFLDHVIPILQFFEPRCTTLYNLAKVMISSKVDLKLIYAELDEHFTRLLALSQSVINCDPATFQYIMPIEKVQHSNSDFQNYFVHVLLPLYTAPILTKRFSPKCFGDESRGILLNHVTSSGLTSVESWNWCYDLFLDRYAGQIMLEYSLFDGLPSHCLEKALRSFKPGSIKFPHLEVGSIPQVGTRLLKLIFLTGAASSSWKRYLIEYIQELNRIFNSQMNPINEIFKGLFSISNQWNQNLIKKSSINGLIKRVYETTILVSKEYGFDSSKLPLIWIDMLLVTLRKFPIRYRLLFEGGILPKLFKICRQYFTSGDMEFLKTSPKSPTDLDSLDEMLNDFPHWQPEYDSRLTQWRWKHCQLLSRGSARQMGYHSSDDVFFRRFSSGLIFLNPPVIDDMKMVITNRINFINQSPFCRNFNKLLDSASGIEWFGYIIDTVPYLIAYNLPIKLKCASQLKDIFSETFESVKNPNATILKLPKELTGNRGRVEIFTKLREATVNCIIFYELTKSFKVDELLAILFP